MVIRSHKRNRSDRVAALQYVKVNYKKMVIIDIVLNKSKLFKSAMKNVVS